MKENLFLYLVVFFSMLISSCVEKKDTSDKVCRGRYLYIDKGRCIHSNLNCVNLVIPLESDKYMLTRIDTSSILIDDFEYSCSSCINDETYEWIIGLTRENVGYLLRSVDSDDDDLLK